MLEVSELTRSYGSFVAVDSVNFTIGQGEIVGLLGHNGAGKTTIMKMLSGYLEPNRGEIRIDGLDLAADAKVIQQRLGYLPENLPVYPELSVADYLDYAADLKGLKNPAKTAEIQRAVKATEIGEKLLSPIATLSRGYKQRVGVAQAILGDPKLLILDEPTNGLDPTQTEHMRQLIRDIAKHATVILSTHIMQEVDALCDRVLILRGGRLAVDAKLETLRHSNRLLLVTSLDTAAAQSKLSAIAGVASLDPQPQQPVAATPAAHHYRLQLADGSQAGTVSAAIAKAVVEAGADLYQLQTEHRDLETLFREVSDAPTAAGQKEDISHAA
ncbi:ABC transporter ATP-binding protein [Exilibacterium tricleocarpae]|uniref:ABC transporter ATP-binding protein n=1 Tax=Exilibacterium tricleocarpae TaxID=2591008 RepID=A0A545U9W3_9GAMM|nr:ABC transporter ATP-binding protein [Exilibacterium tricleocarpae]TQV86256.1 ABC transporter ATP-binding protein [Exilibacterium tricleocarpae]